MQAMTRTRCATAKLTRLKAKKAVWAILWKFDFNGQQSFATENTPITPVNAARQPPHKPPPIWNKKIIINFLSCYFFLFDHNTFFYVTLNGIMKVIYKIIRLPKVAIMTTWLVDQLIETNFTGNIISCTLKNESENSRVIKRVIFYNNYKLD